MYKLMALTTKLISQRPHQIMQKYPPQLIKRKKELIAMYEQFTLQGEQPQKWTG